jgi:hypothetical protein
MELIFLILLYYLSQNPDFAESVKPIMDKIKNSEQMLRFLNDLSKFSQTFSSVKDTPCEPTHPKKPPEEKSPPCGEEEKKNPQSPTKGIADEFIQNMLDNYFKSAT